MTAAGSRTNCIRIRIYVASNGKLGCLHGNVSCLDNTQNNSNNGGNKCDSYSCYLALALRQVVARTTDKRRQLVTKTNANCRAHSLLLSDSVPSFSVSHTLYRVLLCSLLLLLLSLFATNERYSFWLLQIQDTLQLWKLYKETFYDLSSINNYLILTKINYKIMLKPVKWIINNI